MWDQLLGNGGNWRFDISNISTCVCPLLSLKFVEPVSIKSCISTCRNPVKLNKPGNGNKTGKGIQTSYRLYCSTVGIKKQFYIKV